MIELIIFDLDGTLIDSSQDITNAINFAIYGSGIAPLTNEQTIQLVGEGITQLFTKLLSPEQLHMKDDILQKFIDYYSHHLLDNTRPYPYVHETLGRLHKYRMAVVSNKRESLSKKILDGLHLIQHFDAILGSDSVKERKPSAMPIDILRERLSALREACIMVGDSDIDIKTAKAAHIKSVGVTYGYRPEVALRKADYIINDIRELESVITMLV